MVHGVINSVIVRVMCWFASRRCGIAARKINSVLKYEARENCVLLGSNADLMY